MKLVTQLYENIKFFFSVLHNSVTDICFNFDNYNLLDIDPYISAVYIWVDTYCILEWKWALSCPAEIQQLKN